jgi:hypothetical protein
LGWFKDGFNRGIKVMTKGAKAASRGSELGVQGGWKQCVQLKRCGSEEDGLTSAARMSAIGKRQGAKA